MTNAPTEKTFFLCMVNEHWKTTFPWSLEMETPSPWKEDFKGKGLTGGVESLSSVLQSLNDKCISLGSWGFGNLQEVCQRHSSLKLNTGNGLHHKSHGYTLGLNTKRKKIELAFLCSHFLWRLNISSFSLICLGLCIISIVSIQSQKAQQKPLAKLSNSQTANAMRHWYSAADKHPSSLKCIDGKRKPQARAESWVSPRAENGKTKQTYCTIRYNSPVETNSWWIEIWDDFPVSSHWTSEVGVQSLVLVEMWLLRQPRKGSRHPALPCQETSAALGDAASP